jgi:glycosyltransferase involved in cell wall biosynthesis
MNKPAEAGQPLALSVVIPTWNRRDTLARTLAALSEQSAGAPFEVVVADDGSTDGTREFLSDLSGRAPFAFQFALQPRRGPAAARNAALRLARGRILLMMGDDTVPAAGLLERHRRWHEAHPDFRDALLGRAAWPPEMEATPFMRWMERGGHAFFFNYVDIAEGAPVSPMFFYTCNVSVKRDLLFRTALFDETFRRASHEDLELGHRLGREGMRLFFDREAVAYHWHALDVEATVRRIFTMGYSAREYWLKAPDTASAPRRAVRAAAAAVCRSRGARALLRRLIRSAPATGEHPALWLLLAHMSYGWGLGASRAGQDADEALRAIRD